ncbi:MAG TPA: hypothetical protein VM554_14095 [Acidisarcina sp.]|nr:hypothetical protein [Acidisarcina sp.]
MFTAFSTGACRRLPQLGVLFVLSSLQLAAQIGTLNETNRNAQIEQRIDALMDVLNATRLELQESRAEIRALHQELQAMKRSESTSGVEADVGSGRPANELADAVANLKENQEVVQAEVAQHEQSKVEAQSKYPIKITGLVLFHSFVNKGAVDNVDVPVIALHKTPEVAHGSTGATLRQTVLGFDAKGPVVFGAESHADVRVDFFGNQQGSGYLPNEGRLRLRTAHAELDWRKTHLVAMLDKPLISPFSPTSMAVVGVSPLAGSGNLWTWLPQLKLSQDMSWGERHFGIEAGVMNVADPADIYNPSAKSVSAAQRSLYPGSELLLSYTGKPFGRSAIFGVGGYWGPHDYGYRQSTNAWAVTTDWRLALPARLELSGEFYRGRALGGLGGGAYKDVVLVKTLSDPYAQIDGLNAIGGWSQIKYRMSDKIEWNTAYGQDGGYASQLRSAQLDSTNPNAALARNQTAFGNIIYRPSNYLIFSFEFRNIRTWPISGSYFTAQSYVLSTGYEF